VHRSWTKQKIAARAAKCARVQSIIKHGELLAGISPAVQIARLPPYPMLAATGLYLFWWVVLHKLPGKCQYAE